MPSTPNLKLILPAAVVGLVGVLIGAVVVSNWVLDIVDLSFRTEGRYAKQLQVAAPAAQLPKDSALCPAGLKSPWIGCNIQ